MQHIKCLLKAPNQILSDVVSEPENIGAVFSKYFGPGSGIDLDTFNQRKPHDQIRLNFKDNESYASQENEVFGILLEQSIRLI